MYWVNLFPFVWVITYRFRNVIYRHCRLILGMRGFMESGSSSWLIWRLQTLPHRHVHAPTITESKLYPRTARNQGKARIAAVGFLPQVTHGHWRVDQAWDSSQGAVTAGPVFCQDQRFSSRRLTGLSVPSALHYCTWLAAARMEKRKLLTVGFSTDVPAEGLMFQLLYSLGALFWP